MVTYFNPDTLQMILFWRWKVDNEVFVGMMLALAVQVNIEMMLIKLIVLLLLLLLTGAIFATSSHNYHWSLPTTDVIWQDTFFRYFLSNRWTYFTLNTSSLLWYFTMFHKPLPTLKTLALKSLCEWEANSLLSLLNFHLQMQWVITF